MADGRKPVQPTDPALYTLVFGEDGRASFRLDCNRAMGSWQSASDASGSAGSLRFGPLAGTRAMCPQPSLDERVLRDMAFVRSYLVKAGRLHLSLTADGGIYTWEPSPAP